MVRRSSEQDILNRKFGKDDSLQRSTSEEDDLVVADEI